MFRPVLALSRLRKSIVLSGSKENSVINLMFERATNTAALRYFVCGQEIVDHIIGELESYLLDNDLFLVRDGEEVVALYCIQKNPHNLFISEDAKEKMKTGIKPVPDGAFSRGVCFWGLNHYSAIELSLLAVKKDRRGKHIGSFIIEHVIDTLSCDCEDNREFLIVKALDVGDYTAVPFYEKCGFFPAKEKERQEMELTMYRIIPKPKTTEN